MYVSYSLRLLWAATRTANQDRPTYERVLTIAGPFMVTSIPPQTAARLVDEQIVAGGRNSFPPNQPSQPAWGKSEAKSAAAVRRG